MFLDWGHPAHSASSTWWGSNLDLSMGCERTYYKWQRSQSKRVLHRDSVDFISFHHNCAACGCRMLTVYQPVSSHATLACGSKTSSAKDQLSGHRSAKCAPCVRGMCAGQRLWLVALVKLERNDRSFLQYLRNAGVWTEGSLRSTQNMNVRNLFFRNP